MKRSEFIRVLSGGAVLLSLGINPLKSMAGGKRKSLRFGILTDSHYADRDNGGVRHYRDSLVKMDEAVDHFNLSDLDFAIELGDIKDIARDGSVSDTLLYLDEIESRFQRFRGDKYHTLGNHDMDCLTKEEFLAHTINTGRARGKNYYSFVKKGVLCIVLDANFNPDGTPYCRGNFSWTEALIPDEQLAWLKGELSRHSGKPTLVFLHHLLDDFSNIDSALCVNNAAAVVEILEQSGQVLAVFQGHHHLGHYSHRRGIHYVTLQGMVEHAAPRNSYAIVELLPSGDIRVDGIKDCVSRELKR